MYFLATRHRRRARPSFLRGTAGHRPIHCNSIPILSEERNSAEMWEMRRGDEFLQYAQTSLFATFLGIYIAKGIFEPRTAMRGKVGPGCTILLDGLRQGQPQVMLHTRGSQVNLPRPSPVTPYLLIFLAHLPHSEPSAN